MRVLFEHRGLTGMTLDEMLKETQGRMVRMCKANIDDINWKCSYGGESLSDHIECFNASKEVIRENGIPNYWKGDNYE